MFPYSKTITSCLIFLEAFLVITNLGSGNDADSAFFCYSSGKFTQADTDAHATLYNCESGSQITNLKMF